MTKRDVAHRPRERKRLAGNETICPRPTSSGNILPSGRTAASWHVTFARSEERLLRSLRTSRACTFPSIAIRYDGYVCPRAWVKARPWAYAQGRSRQSCPATVKHRSELISRRSSLAVPGCWHEVATAYGNHQHHDAGDGAQNQREHRLFHAKAATGVKGRSLDLGLKQTRKRDAT